MAETHPQPDIAPPPKPPPLASLSILALPPSPANKSYVGLDPNTYTFDYVFNLLSPIASRSRRLPTTTLSSTSLAATPFVMTKNLRSKAPGRGLILSIIRIQI
ncbi:hypothetical protein COP2_014249 [Malus domestica]